MTEEDKIKKTQVEEDGKEIKYTVMPTEFRKAPPKKIKSKFFLIGGGVLLLAGLSAAIVLFFNQTPPAIVVENPPEEEQLAEEEMPPEVEATSTEPSLLNPIPEIEEESPTSTEPEVITKLVPGTDADADGLTDKEENVFQTDPTKPDTDGDGFLDGNEVFHLYDPARPTPVTLLESGTVKVFRNATLGYSVYYPTVWTASSSIDMSRVEFMAPQPDNDIVRITAEKVDSSKDLRAWYQEKFPNGDINSLQSFTSKQGYQGLQDEERLNTYIKKNGKILIITYDLNGTNIVWFRGLYGMILNSLVID